MRYPQPIILLVDDDENLCRYLSEEFQGLKFRTDIAYNGIEALEKLKKNTYNLVIMGIKMPEMEGDEVLEKMDEYDLQVPVIILTGYADVEIAKRCARLGASDFFPKPYDFDELLDSVIKHIRIDVFR